MSNKIFVYGCGDLGRQVKWLAARAGLEVAGFIDDGGCECLVDDIPVVSPSRFLEGNGAKPCSIVIAISCPGSRASVVKKLSHFEWFSFPLLIDNQAIVAPSSSLGSGTIVFPGAIIDVSSSIGSFVVVNKLCSIGHDVRIDDFSTLSPMVMIGGRVSIASSCFLGASASLRQGLSVCSGSTIGMGAVVVKDVSTPGVYVGSPARLLGGR